MTPRPYRALIAWASRRQLPSVYLHSNGSSSSGPTKSISDSVSVRSYMTRSDWTKAAGRANDTDRASARPICCSHTCEMSGSGALVAPVGKLGEKRVYKIELASRSGVWASTANPVTAPREERRDEIGDAIDDGLMTGEPNLLGDLARVYWTT
jgi:hypothetical protein